MMQLRHLGRYLAETQNYVQVLEYDYSAPPQTVQVYVDANWGNGADRRSTSGGLLKYEGFQLQQWSRTQPCIAQSTCEAELIAANAGASEGRQVQNLMQDIGIKVQMQILTDSNSARQIIMKRGPGRMKHLDINHNCRVSFVMAG